MGPVDILLAAGILEEDNPAAGSHVAAGCSSLERYRLVAGSRRLVVVVGIGVGRRREGLCCSLPF